LLELVRLDVQLRKTDKETAERGRVEDAINSVRAKLPAPILGHFDRQKSRGKLGIAPVRGGVCGACHLKMPLGHVAELRHKQDDLALCDNCGTYIYLPPDEMVVLPASPAGIGRPRTPLTHV
jgi:predicted  nucleic acid-binding Zn-ribbon protein